MAPVRTATKMEKSQSENPATEFAQFSDQVDREMTGENLPLTEKHEGSALLERSRLRNISKFINMLLGNNISLNRQFQL